MRILPADVIHDEDIYANYREGVRLFNGINPDERILSEEMARNDDYATYLPFPYIFFPAGFGSPGGCWAYRSPSDKLR